MSEKPEGLSVDLDQITTGTVDGSGVFDVLMRTVTTQLDRQFQSGRMTGNDIADVLSSVLPSVLEQSITYTLSRCKIAAEVGILNEQVQEAMWKARAAQIEVELGKTAIDKANAEIRLLMEQLELVKQQIITEKANVDGSVIVDEESVLGTQRLVQQRQADGFLRDAEQKSVSLLWDVLKVMVSVGEDYDRNALGLHNDNFKNSLKALMNGAGISNIT